MAVEIDIKSIYEKVKLISTFVDGLRQQVQKVIG